ncbi:MAG: GGDEF domain-containing protein [Lachnospiraceae bacterium]|nr:GGDEF domain-containing protein [Lachnospiraceae bacterium]
MKKRIRIQKVSTWNITITIIVALLFIVVSVAGEREFGVLRNTTEQYIVCENAAKQLQDGSDYLTEQVRLYAMTGEQKYRDLYFEEANTTRRRENALEELGRYFEGSDAIAALQSALQMSQELMQSEYYSMCLVEEADGEEKAAWPEELQNVELSGEDAALADDEKRQKAQELVCSSEYQEVRDRITDSVSQCMADLIARTRNSQGRASSIFSDMYLKLEIGIVILAVLMLSMCLIIRKLIVKPLLSYNESIKRGEIFPVIGAAELQNLAETYNKVYMENQETQKLIRHEAEHDALTDLLNRGSFEKVFEIYENGDQPYALILIDVDTFKSVNDTYGHATGDKILQKVSKLLKNAFRSIDYICRIGGDEFAIVMVEMTSDLQYTICDKINAVNTELAKAEADLPAVSLSVGVAFSDRENPGESIFKDADKALYKVKENGKNGCGFY